MMSPRIQYSNICSPEESLVQTGKLSDSGLHCRIQ